MFSCMCRKSKSWDLPTTKGLQPSVPKTHIETNGTTPLPPPENGTQPSTHVPTPKSILKDSTKTTSNSETQLTVNITDSPQLSSDVEAIVESDEEISGNNVDVKRRSGLVGYAANVETQNINDLKVIKNPKTKR